MRRTALLVAVLLAGLTGVAGCTGKPVPLPIPAPATRPVPVDVAVYLNTDVTEPQREAIQARLRELPGVSAVGYVSRDEAYRQFKETFKDRPDLVDQVRPESLPESFRFRLPDRTAAEPVMAELRQLPGVQEVKLLPQATSVPTTSPTG